MSVRPKGVVGPTPAVKPEILTVSPPAAVRTGTFSLLVGEAAGRRLNVRFVAAPKTADPLTATRSTAEPLPMLNNMLPPEEVRLERFMVPEPGVVVSSVPVWRLALPKLPASLSVPEAPALMVRLPDWLLEALLRARLMLFVPSPTVKAPFPETAPESVSVWAPPISNVPALRVEVPE